MSYRTSNKISTSAGRLQDFPAPCFPDQSSHVANARAFEMALLYLAEISKIESQAAIRNTLQVKVSCKAIFGLVGP